MPTVGDRAIASLLQTLAHVQEAGQLAEQPRLEQLYVACQEAGVRVMTHAHAKKILDAQAAQLDAARKLAAAVLEGRFASVVSDLAVAFQEAERGEPSHAE